MIRIPVDVAAPVACTATGDDLTHRLEQIEHLRDRLAAVDRTATGLLLRFAPDPAIEAALERFAGEEKGCCQFWGFEVASTDDGLTLAWDGPQDAQPLLDELLRCLRGDLPATALAGLL